ncbi:MAG: hypothetical protein GWO39_05250, partial [Gammaproteobacteria bacterium]|nr:hypothetical protein [Gammaproteobacteria bacterium]NIT63209.1 hypothetical protein [Gammaproteobacteria bacterium]NIV21456.1 hypothetical protein [Gammaproteobacteria bacterium]NIY31789.1 hypothetical protein [Gammaproteobacteria bacterium]
DTVDQFSGSPSAAETEAYLTKYLDTSNFYRAQTFVNVVANLALFNIGLGAGQLDQQRFGFTFTDAN